MLKWTMLVVAIVLFVLSCTPVSAPTQTPTKAIPTSASKPAAEATKPAAAVPTPGSKAAVKPLQPSASLKVGITGALSDMVPYIAEQKGYFAEEGLKVDVTLFSSAAQMTAPLGTGELDVSTGSPAPALFNAISRGIPIKIVADSTSAQPGQAIDALLVRKDLIDSGQIKTFSDLKGKKIAVTVIGASGDITVDRALQKGGVKREEVEMVPMAFTDFNSALIGKSIDVASSFEPGVTQAVAQGIAVRWKGGDEVYPYQELSVLLYGPNFYRDKAEAAKRYMVAYLRASRDMLNALYKNVNREELFSIMMKNSFVKDRALYDKMKMGINPDGYAYTQGISEDQDWFVAKGLMQEKLDLSKVIDNQYVEYALGRLGKYQR